jgi:hypothetical protein
MPRTGFTPQQHGFHFDNDFVNKTAPLPGFGQIETRGRCGGMAYAALDFYYADLPVPATKTLPGDRNPLARYIYRRLLDSFLTPSAVQFVTWTLHADHGTWFLKGVTRWTKEDQIPRLRGFIDAGRPVVLGMVGASDLANVGSGNHQVVAYGYEVDEPTQTTRVFIYDNNNHDEEVVLTTDPRNPHVNASNRRQPWRGFFVQSYAPVTPAPGLAPDPGAGWWSQDVRLTGADNDLIDVHVEPDAVVADVVEFELEAGPGTTVRKTLELAGGGGDSKTLQIEDGQTHASGTLPVDQLAGGHLTFRKLKWLTTDWEILRLEHADQVKPGSRVTFTWVRD